jgi:hypothetical protein
MALPRYSNKELTKHLRTLAMEAHDLTESGEVQTRAEALAKLIWLKALGYKKMEYRGEASNRILVEVEHPPESWCIQLIYERLEGKVPQAAVDDAGKTTAAERVSDLARTRINTLAGAPVTPDGKPLPPKPLPPKPPPKLPSLDQLPTPKPT